MPSTAPSPEILSAGFAYIKGTRYEPRPTVKITEAGPVGDRRYCLINVQKRHVLKTVQHPELLRVRVEEKPSGLRVIAPGIGEITKPAVPTGQTITCDYWGRPAPITLLDDGPSPTPNPHKNHRAPANHSELFSRYLGIPVHLGLAPSGSIIYGAPISVIATASVHDLGKRLDPTGSLNLLNQFARFRSTLLIRTKIPYEEEDWRDHIIELTAAPGILKPAIQLPHPAAPQDQQPTTLHLHFGQPIPRCAVIDANPVTGKRDLRLLKTLTSYRPANDRREPLFGMYATLA